MKKGEIIEDVYYTMEKYSYLMADIDLSMSMRDVYKRQGRYIGIFKACIRWKKY